MKTVNKTVLVLHAPQKMSDLVNAVDRYHEFLPWCNYSRFVNQCNGSYTAEIGMAFAGLQQSFSTRNTTTCPEQGAYTIQMELVEGPFSDMQGTWSFTPIAGDAQACRVTFALHYAFSSKTLALAVGPVFEKIADNLVDAFVKRAEQVYASV